MRRAELKTATGRAVTVELENGFADVFVDGVLVATMTFADGVGEAKAWKMAFYAARGLACQIGHAARKAAEGGAGRPRQKEGADKTLKKIIDNHKKWLDGEGGCRADFRHADLRGADLSEADLRSADLSEANLHGADLSEATLHGADLSEANLHGADFHWADLHGADLHGADLSEADLYNAELRGADLSGADLRGANLAGAGLCWANLRDADLHGANLDFSSWPLWCGSLTAKIDAGLAAQLMYHAVRACQSVTDDKVVSAVCRAPEVVALANRFARAEECGPIKGKEGDAE